jgi:predicted CXXCH cytochrome family protein
MRALAFALLTVWVLLAAGSAHGAPPVFDKPGVVYHPDVKKCAGCHPGAPKEYRVPRPVDALCYRCHDRKDSKKLVHGPLGSGECTICHDPHGSPHRALTVASPEVLCNTCHDQASSAKHMRESKAMGCVTCHEPHSSSKAYLRK